MLSFGREESRCGGRLASGRDHRAARARELVQLAIGLERDALDSRQHHRAIPVSTQSQAPRLHSTQARDGFVVDEVQVEAGLEDSRHQVGSEAIVQHLDQMHIPAAGELRPRVVVRQVERDVVPGLTLTQDEAHPLQVAGEIGHGDPPRVLFVVGARRVEAPARILDALRGVRPAMTDELVDSLEEMEVGLHLQVERSRAKHRRVKPCPGFRRRDGATVEVARRRRPAGGADGLPLMALAFGEVRHGVARNGGGWNAVSLNAEEGAIPRGPFLDRLHEPFVEQFGERLAPVTPDARGLRSHIGHERGQVRPQVVASTLLKFLKEIVGPIGAVGLQAVAEDRVGRLRPEGLHQTIAHVLEITLGRSAIVVIQHETLGPDRGPLHHHAGPTRDEELELVARFNAFGEEHRAVPDLRHFAQTARRHGLAVQAGREHGNQLLGVGEGRHGHAPRALRDLHTLDAEPGRRVRHRHRRSSKRPAAAHGQVHAQSQLASLHRGEVQGIDEPIGEEGEVLDAALRVVERERIDGLDLEASDPAFLHELHLPLELRLRHRRPEPPPSHHDAAVVGRGFEEASHFRDAGVRRRRPLRLSDRGNGGQKREQGEPRYARQPGSRRRQMFHPGLLVCGGARFSPPLAGRASPRDESRLIAHGGSYRLSKAVGMSTTLRSRLLPSARCPDWMRMRRLSGLKMGCAWPGSTPDLTAATSYQGWQPRGVRPLVLLQRSRSPGIAGVPGDAV